MGDSTVENGEGQLSSSVDNATHKTNRVNPVILMTLAASYCILLLSIYAWLSSGLFGLLTVFSFAIFITASVYAISSGLGPFTSQQRVILTRVTIDGSIFLLFIAIFWGMGILALWLALASVFLIDFSMQIVLPRPSGALESD